MKIVEFLLELRNKGLSDNDISNISKITTVQIHRIRTGLTKRPNPSTCKALADAFNYELKYIDGEPHFFPKSAPPANAPPADEETAAALEVYRYLKELGIDSKEDLESLFDKAGAVFGTGKGEIKSIIEKLYAIDAIRALVKNKEVK